VGRFQQPDAICLWKLHAADPSAGSIALRGQYEGIHAVSPDSRWLATINGSGVTLWDLQAPAPEQARLDLPLEHVGRIAFSPDGRWLACRSGARVALWEVAAAAVGGPVTEWIGGHTDTDPVSAFAFTNDGSELITAGRTGTVRAWALPRAPSRGTTPLSTDGPTTSVSLSPDSRWVLAVGADGGSFLLDRQVMRVKLVYPPGGPFGGTPPEPKFSPDSR
jgi:WD40 repeat protein